MVEKNRKPSEEVQLEMPGVSSVDTIIKTWMQAFIGTAEYEKHKGEFALFDGVTGTHLGYRKLTRDVGDDRFSDIEEEDPIPSGAKTVRIL